MVMKSSTGGGIQGEGVNKTHGASLVPSSHVHSIINGSIDRHSVFLSRDRRAYLVLHFLKGGKKDPGH